jgi:hypothetical protein
VREIERRIERAESRNAADVPAVRCRRASRAFEEHLG